MYLSQAAVLKKISKIKSVKKKIGCQNCLIIIIINYPYTKLLY